MIERFLAPTPISFDQRVCHFDELTHDDDDGDLCGFSDCSQGIIFGLEIRVEPHGDQCGHVKGVAQRFASASDE